MNKVAAVVVMLVLSLVTACAPAAPAPTATPQPTATPVEVRATKVEHLVGIWFDGDAYGRYEADGTSTWAESIENLDIPHLCAGGTFWFEDGIYYEEGWYCEGIWGCEAYLRIEEGRAVRLRLKVVEAPEQPCDVFGLSWDRTLVRAD
jgi:hypothetical protein